MSDAESPTVTAPMTESEDSKMETETQAQPQPQPQPKKEEDASNALLRIWPPRQRTRDAVVTRLIETLSTPSILSNRYGTLPADKAATAARTIEEEAFGVASAASSAEDDGIEILSLYSKEISKRMLESIKARAAAATSNSVDASASLQAEA